MNRIDAYRKSAFTAPLNSLLAQLHRQAGVFTQQVAHFAELSEVEEARKHIQYVQDIIAFLRSSLDMSLEASQKTDSVYAYFYGIMARWYLNVLETPEECQAMLDFWRSWEDTWMRATAVPNY